MSKDFKLSEPYSEEESQAITDEADREGLRLLNDTENRIEEAKVLLNLLPDMFFNDCDNKLTFKNPTIRFFPTLAIRYESDKLFAQDIITNYENSMKNFKVAQEAPDKTFYRDLGFLLNDLNSIIAWNKNNN